MNLKAKGLANVCTAMILVLVASISCSSLKEEDILGTYHVQYRSGGSETITLTRDGKYSQTVVVDPRYLQEGTAPKDGLTLRQSGEYKYDKDEGNIYLKNPLSVDVFAGKLNADFKNPINGIVCLGIVRFPPWAKIRLTTAYEGEYFSLQKATNAKKSA